MYWEGVSQVGKLVLHFSNISPELQPISEDVLKMSSWGMQQMTAKTQALKTSFWKGCTKFPDIYTPLYPFVLKNLKVCTFPFSHTLKFDIES